MDSVPDGGKHNAPLCADDALPARPIRSRPALWVPRAATVGCLGLSLWYTQKFHGLRGVSALAAPFFGTSQGERVKALLLMRDLTSPFLIWQVEGYRAGSATNPLAYPIIFGAAVQVFGIEKVAPVYCLISMYYGPGDLGRDNKRIDPDVARAVLPATLMGYVLPAALMSVLPLTATEVSRSNFTLQSATCHLFYLSPITISALTVGISKAYKWFRGKRNAKTRPVDDPKPGSGRQNHHKSEVAALKTAYHVVFGLQTSATLAIALPLCYKLYNIVRRLPPSERTKVRDQIIRGMTRFNPRVSFRLTTLSYGLYTIWDMRRLGYTTTRKAIWAAVAFVGVGELCGAGAGYASLWHWREGVRNKLRRRRKPSSVA